MSDWTDEQKQEVIQKYVEQEPTGDTSAEIVKELAEEYGKTVNGVRMILVRAEKYVSKGKATTAASGGEAKTPRKSKQDSLDELSALLTKHSVVVDSTVIDKLTGKAAEFFIGAFNQIIEG